MTSKKIKYWIREIHLWMGLIAGIFLFLICLSGTILTYETEINSFLSPTKELIIPVAKEKLSHEEVISHFEQTTGGKVAGIAVLDDVNSPLQLMIKIDPKDRRGKNFQVNPYTLEVLNDPNHKSGVMFFFFKLHRWLLLKPFVGSPIVGVATIICILLLFSGLYLWWPKSRDHLKRSLKVKVTGKFRKLNYDLHNTLGFYSLFFILLMCLTGLCWSFDWYRAGLSSVLSAEVFGDRRSKPERIEGGGSRMPLEEVLKIFNAILPYKGKTTIQLGKRDSAVVVSKTPLDSFKIQASDRVQINPYSGEVLKLEKFSDKPLGKKIASLIRPLHTGEFFGGLSKFIYFITCLVATTLPITGTIIWFNKKKKGQKHA